MTQVQTPSNSPVHTVYESGSNFRDKVSQLNLNTTSPLSSNENSLALNNNQPTVEICETESDSTQPIVPERTHAMWTRAQNNIFKSKKILLATRHPITAECEPTSATVAVKDANWKQAMCDELHALVKNKTWKLVPPPSNRTIIGCKWILS